MRPDVLLMDEPLSNLDALLRLHMRAELKRLHREIRATTVYVTHDQVEALSLGDRIAVMKDGEIVQCAAPMEIYDRPASRFVGGFIGSPPMNFLTGTVARSNGAMRVEVGGTSIPLPAGTAVAGEGTIGIRPEHIAVTFAPMPAAVPARRRWSGNSRSSKSVCRSFYRARRRPVADDDGPGVGQAGAVR